MLLDSNIIIYASRPENPNLRSLIAKESPAVSVVSYAEVLGYHRLGDQELQFFADFFSNTLIIQLSTDVIDHSVLLRQQRKMSLGDALIGATALVHDLELVTANLRDFQWIPGLQLINPMA